MKKRILAAYVCLSLILTCISCTTPIGQEAEQNHGKDSEKHSEKDLEISVKWISTETDYENILSTPFAEYGEVKIKASEDRYIYKCGIVDAEGNIIVPIIYDEAFPFSKGQYFVQTQSEKKVINAKGEQLFDLSKYDTVDLPTDGFSIVTLNGKEGLITESGKEILPCEYTDVQYNLYLIWAEKDGVWSFFDRNGMQKSDAVYDKIECLRNLHSRGRNYEFNELFKVSKSGKYGVADKEGKEIFPCTYSDLEICDNDVVAVFDGGWKYININDNSSYYVGGYPERFSEGLAPLYSDGKYGYINKKWELVIPCKYYDASAFLGGVATVKESPDDLGYLIDKTGKTVVEEKDYDVAVKGEGLTGIIYPNGKAYVRFGPPESIEAVLDERGGNPLTEFIYKGVTDFKNGLAVAYKDESGIGLKGLISKSGEEITPFIYENIEFVCDNKYAVIMYDKTNGKEKVGILTVAISPGNGTEITEKKSLVFSISQGLKSYGIILDSQYLTDDVKGEKSNYYEFVSLGDFPSINSIELKALYHCTEENIQTQSDYIMLNYQSLATIFFCESFSYSNNNTLMTYAIQDNETSKYCFVCLLYDIENNMLCEFILEVGDIEAFRVNSSNNTVKEMFENVYITEAPSP